MRELQLAIHDLDVHPLTVVGMYADMYAMIGMYKLNRKDASIEMAKEGFEYLERSLSLFNQLGQKQSASTVEAKITYFRPLYAKKFGDEEGFGRPVTKDDPN
jgi:hypothetical protein